MHPTVEPSAKLLKMIAHWAKRDRLVAMPLEEAPGCFGFGFHYRDSKKPTPFKPEHVCFASMTIAQMFVRRINAGKFD